MKGLLGYQVNRYYGHTFGEVDITEQLEQDLRNELMIEDELMFLVPNPKFRTEYYIVSQLLTSRKRASRRIKVRAQVLTEPDKSEVFKSYKFDRLVIANVYGVLFYDSSSVPTLRALVDMLSDQLEANKDSQIINEYEYY